jgi:hypothetical protein
MIKLFDAERFSAPMAPIAEGFRNAFTAAGFAAVMITAIRRVAKARSGEESMGWVASMVMTVSLMAIAPQLGTEVFQSAQEIADKSGYKGTDTIGSCWKALEVLMPASSPIQDTIETQQTPPPAQPTDLKKITLKMLVSGLFSKSWDQFKGLVGTISAYTNKIMVFLVILLPSTMVLLGAIITSCGELLRQVLRQGMDVFMPMMIAMLSFAPMRGAAHSFIMRYISVAMWPVAWALSNCVAVSLLVSAMQWVVSLCRTVQTAQQSVDPLTDPLMSAGLFAAAAELLPWRTLILINVVVIFVSLLLIVGTVGAPIALNKVLVQGAGFVGDQLRHVISSVSWAASGPSPHGFPSGGITPPGSPASGGASSGGGWSARTSGALSGAASRLSAVAPAVGAMAAVARLGASALTKTAMMIQDWSGSSTSSGQSSSSSSEAVFSMARGRMEHTHAATSRASSTGTPRPRNFRRT